MTANRGIIRPAIDPNRTPFHETAAFRRYGVTPEPAPHSPEDLYLKALIREQGFDGLPEVAPRRMLDA
jgi:hypothetical protein